MTDEKDIPGTDKLVPNPSNKSIIEELETAEEECAEDVERDAKLSSRPSDLLLSCSDDNISSMEELLCAVGAPTDKRSSNASVPFFGALLLVPETKDMQMLVTEEKEIKN